MARLSILLASVVFMSFSIGCTDSKKGESKPPASPEMTKRVTHALSSVEKVFEMNGAKLVVNDSPNFIAGFMTPEFPQSTEQTSIPSDVTPLDAEISAQRLNSVLSSNDCVFDIPIDQDPGFGQRNEPSRGAAKLQATNTEMKISGATCPLEATISIVGEEKNNVVTIDINILIVAKTTEMQEELKAKSVLLAGTVDGIVQEIPGKSGAAGVKTKFQMKLSGSGVLQDDTSFSMGISGSMAMDLAAPDEATMNAEADQSSGSMIPDLGALFGGMNMDMSMSQNYDFGDTATVLSAITSMKGFANITEKYTVNGAQVTKEEFDKYATEITIPGFSDQVHSSDPQQGRGQSGRQDKGIVAPGLPMMCLLRVFDAYEVPLSTLQSLVQNGSTIQAFPLQTVLSCARNASSSFSHYGQEIQARLVQNQGYIVGDVRVGLETSPLFISRTAADHVYGQVGDLTVSLMCNPVPVCQQ